MGIEIEKKYRIDKKGMVELAARLRELAAEFRYETFEENFLHRGGLLDGKAAVLRVRKTESRSTLTYKEKIESGGEFKQQIEFESDVSNVEAIESIIDKLGYKLSVVYEKHRKAWNLSGTEVVLDELPFGYYMEIEGEIENILAVEKMLEAERFEPETRGYPRLSVKHGKEIDGVTYSLFDKKTTAQ